MPAQLSHSSARRGDLRKALRRARRRRAPMLPSERGGATRRGASAVPIVTVQQSPRDLERKRRLVAGITQAFVDAYELSPEQVQVFIHEVDGDNWAKAGTLASDR
jgi:4-oxalocrotonate tautomerase